MFTISKELQSEIRRYSARIAYDIRSRRKREEVKREFAEHLEDAVYFHMIHRRMNEREAFEYACKELGSMAKLQVLMAATHNKDLLPSGIRLMLTILGLVLIGASYFWIENESYRSYFIVILQATIFVLGVTALLRARLYIRALFIRAKTCRQIKKYAEQHGLTFIRRANSYRSIFNRTADPEWILETETERYILLLFATVRRRKTLRITDAEFYEYERNFAFSLPVYNPVSIGLSIVTSNNGTATQNFFFAQSGISTLSQGVHLFPLFNWEAAEHPTKRNVRVLLLNPIPFTLYIVVNGHARESGSSDSVNGMHIWSATGLIDYLETERLLGKDERSKHQKYQGDIS